jgi:multidrug efflux system membrane fusion protein
LFRKSEQCCPFLGIYQVHANSQNPAINLQGFPVLVKNKHKIVSATALLVAFAASAVVWKASANNPPPAAAPQLPEVDVAEVSQQRITDWQAYSGRLEAVQRAEIRPQVAGVLTAVRFKDGSLVKKGDPLFTIDPRPYAAEVARAEAQLAGAEARNAYAGNELARGERLLVDNAIARREFEEKQNAAHEALAKLREAKAALQLARLNLEYTQIVAPIAGRVSRAEITVGNLVTPNGTQALTSIISADQIYVAFDVDEQSYLKQVATGEAGLPVQVALGDEETPARQGRLVSVDNRLDTRSGTIRLRALIDNREARLLPGLYARVQLGSAAEREALLVDEKAVGTDQSKRFVLALDAANKAGYREVKLGSQVRGLRVVESGLKAGDRIVVNGLHMVQPGATIKPRMVPMAGSPAAATAAKAPNGTDDASAPAASAAAPKA